MEQKQYLLKVRDGAGNIRYAKISFQSLGDAQKDADEARRIGQQNGWSTLAAWTHNAIPEDILDSLGFRAPDVPTINDFPDFGAIGSAEPGGGFIGGGFTGGGDGGGFGDVSPEPGGVSEAFDFGPGFEAGLGRLGINIGGGGGVQGAVAGGQFNPLASRFFAQEAFRPGGDPTGAGAGTSFQNFLANQGAAGTLFGGAGSLASRNLLDTARGFTDFSDASLPSPIAGTVLNPATTTQGIRLANVARDAGRQRFGSLARFLPSAGDLSQSFLAQDQPTRSSFADYLNQRIFG